MKNRRPLGMLLLVAVVFAIGAKGYAVYRQKWLNRSLVIAIVHKNTRQAVALLALHADPNAPLRPPTPSTPSAFQGFWMHLLHQKPEWIPSSDEDPPLLRLLAPDETTMDAPPENAVLVRSLLDHGAHVNVQSVGSERATPLTLASMWGFKSTVTLLLQHGAAVNVQDGMGLSALQYAALLDNAQIVELLLNSGADANQVDPEGYTPLMSAILSLNGRPRGEPVKVVVLLLAHHANVNLQDNDGGTALAEAHSKEPCAKEIIRLLKRYGARY